MKYLVGFALDAGQDLPEDARMFGGRAGRDVRHSYALEFKQTFFKALPKRFGDAFMMVRRAAVRNIWVRSPGRPAKIEETKL